MTRLVQANPKGDHTPRDYAGIAWKACVWIALYVSGMWYSDAFVLGPASVTLFWPAAGIAFAVVVGMGLRWAAIIPVGVLIGHATFARVPSDFVPFSVLSNLLGALAGVWWVRLSRSRTTHRTISVRAILGGAIAMSVVAAGIGTVGLVRADMVPASAAAPAFMKWVLGDLLGIACMAPTVLLLMARRSDGVDTPPRTDYARRPERALWVGAYAGTYAFLYWIGSHDSPYVLGIVAFPLALLVWSAFRFERLWTALATLVAVFVVTSLTGLGLVAFQPPSTTVDVMLLLAFLNLVAILPLMLMEAIHVHRVTARRSVRLVAEAAQVQHAQLENLVSERTRQLDDAVRQLEHVSQTDALTGLRNRRYVARQLPLDVAFYEREARAARLPPQALYFALVDIDHFKQINDRLGHKAGDEVLQQFATLLTSLVRSGDYAVRWGGEEFLLVLRPMPPECVTVLGERIRSRIASSVFTVSGHPPMSLTCSIGFSEHFLPDRGAGPTWEQLVELADAALYWIKRNGRDGWAVLRPAPGINREELHDLVRNGAQAALDAGTVVVLTGAGQR